MDPAEFSRALLSDSSELHLDAELIELDHFAAALMEEAPRDLGLGLGGPWDFSYPGDVGIALTEPHPSATQAPSPLSPPLGDGDFYLTKIPDEEEALENLEREFRSQSDVEVFFSDHDQNQGVEHAADDGNQADNNLEEAMSHERGSNNLTDARVSGVHCHNRRAGDADAAASSQVVSGNSYNHRRDEPDHSMNQEHSLINHKPSRGASCTALLEAIGEEDEAQSPYDAGVDGEKLVSDGSVPTLESEFCSEEAVYHFYNKYAKQIGFNVRRGKAEYCGSNKAMIKAKYFLCSCQGHKSKEQIDKLTRYKRRDTRTGCEAMIKCTVSGGTWKISKVFLDHNHPLKGGPAVAPGRAEDASAMTALSTDNIVNEVRTVGEQAPVSNVDCGDVSRGTGKNHPMPEPEDTQDLIDHFKSRQIQDPSFFYTAQVKATPGMASFFWRDSRSKIDYEHFGDVLVLDTRTEINKYGMICAAFWGLNHHRERIIFGCAFLIDRTVASLKWLLRSFLEAMSWQKPRTIITEVSEEIADALRVDLPETSHCLPFWSILNGFTKNLSPLSDQPGVGDLLSECVFHVNSQEEFELKWNALVANYTLHENEWVTSLYRMRQNWSHVFTKKVFSAGLLSIQNDEDARPVFGNLSCESMTLSQIARQCAKVAEDMRRKEVLEDKRCEKNTANLRRRSPVEREAECFYTRPIFRMLQEELMCGISLEIEESAGTSSLREFKLTEHGSTNTDTVKFDPANSTLACSCGKFESVGILCFHALKVLNFVSIYGIPSRYLLKRWAKSAKDSMPVITPSAGIGGDRDPVDSFLGEFMRKASHVAHGCGTKKRKRIALRFIDLAWENIAKFSRTEEMEGDSKGIDAL